MSKNPHCELAATVGDFLNLVLTPANMDPVADMLAKQGLSPEKIRQAIQKITTEAIARGWITQRDLQEP